MCIGLDQLLTAYPFFFFYSLINGGGGGSYASFDTKFAKNGPSVARSHDILYSHVGTKFAQNLHFALCLCTKHMEITDYLKML